MLSSATQVQLKKDHLLSQNSCTALLYSYQSILTEDQIDYSSYIELRFE